MEFLVPALLIVTVIVLIYVLRRKENYISEKKKRRILADMFNDLTRATWYFRDVYGSYQGMIVAHNFDDIGGGKHDWTMVRIYPAAFRHAKPRIEKVKKEAILTLEPDRILISPTDGSRPSQISSYRSNNYIPCILFSTRCVPLLRFRKIKL